jgi:hypothetical protein
MAFECPFLSPSQTYGFWVSLLKSFSNLWLLIVPSQVLLKLMASGCPFSSPSQVWEGLKKGQSEAISLRRTWEGTLRSHKFEKDLRRDTQKPWLSLLKSFWNIWLLLVPSQVLLKLMASECPFLSLSETYGFCVSLLKSFSNYQKP